MHKSITIAALSALLLGACALGPEYQRPAAPVPQAWPEGDAHGTKPRSGDPTPAAGAVLLPDPVRSPQLRQLVRQAVENNRDLRVATLNVEAARAAHRITVADQLPTVGVGTTLDRQKTPEALAGAAAGTSTQYAARISATAFEIDLFGRLRSLGEAALEEFLATEQGRDSVRLALEAQVADTFLTLLADRSLLDLTEETLAAQEKSFSLVKSLADHGEGSRLDVAQARTALEAARANRERYLRQVAQDGNALTLLVGAPVAPDAAGGISLDGDLLLDEVPAELSSRILLGRPDIRQAEHVLKSANANIGAARAAFYPSITLTGSLGQASVGLGDLFSGAGRAWSFLPAISLPIFDGGRNEAVLRTTEIRREIAVAQYEKSIQRAFREVADELAARETLGRQIEAQDALVRAAEDSHRLSQARYAQGVDSYLSVLDAQRSLYAARQEQIGVRLSRLRNTVALYKALGSQLP